MKHRGFTLIELLIVVAIIAILAAIAVPNFLEAQTRSRVSRTLNDLRTISLAMETYRIDNSSYPAHDAVSPLAGHGTQTTTDKRLLTTPIAYLSTVPLDIFRIIANSGGGQYGVYAVTYVATTNLTDYPSGYRRDYDLFPKTSWMTWSWGPDGLSNTGGYFSKPKVEQNERTANPSIGVDKNNVTIGATSAKFGMRYDATNGTVSYGDIYRWEGESQTRDN